MLLTVLKIFLYIILILLLVILLLLAVILLARLKYSIDGEYDDTDGKFELFVRASWLFGLIKAEYDHGGENEGFRLILPFGLGKKKNTPEETEPQQCSETDTKTDPTFDTGIQNSDPAVEEEIQTSEDEALSFTAEESNEPEEYYEEPKDAPKKRRNKGHNRESFIDKIRKKYKSFEKFKEAYDIPLLIRNCFDCLWSLLKAVGIKKGNLSGILGLSDPSQTGMLMGGLSIANIYLPLEMDINGDFAKKRIVLKADIIGKTYLFKVLWPVLVFIFKKPVRSIIWDYLFKKDGNKKDKVRKRKGVKNE